MSDATPPIQSNTGAPRGVRIRGLEPQRRDYSTEMRALGAEMVLKIRFVFSSKEIWKQEEQDA